MKTTRFFLLLLAVLVCSPILANAQNKDLINQEYFKLKSKQTEFQGKGLVKPDLILLSETQKLTNGTARVRFVIDGKLSQQDFQIQALQVTRDSNGKILKTENVGDATSIRARIPKNQIAKEIIANPEVIIPVESQANAVEITLNLEKDNLGNIKLIVPLSEELEVIGLRLFQPNTTSNFDGDCNCPYVELTNSRCGTVGKYCGGYIGNDLDGTTCTVTCGSDSTNKDCVTPVGGDES
jgi:hypothetical protein